jgi:DNA polymerase V
VFDITDPALCDDVLAKTDIIDIWGINKGLANRLQDINVYSAKDLRDLDIRQARKLLTVVGGRIVTELRGIHALPLELVAPVKKTLTCSRSFTSAVRTKSELMESLTNYLSTAAEKLRTNNLMTNALTVFIQTDRFRDTPQYSNSATVKVNPTDSTRELLSVAGRILDAIYKPGYGYKKSGVIFLGLKPAEAIAPRLFDAHLYLKDKNLMKAMDEINAKFGKRTIRFGLPAKHHTNWTMSRNYLSPAYTTNIDQVLRVTV